MAIPLPNIPLTKFGSLPGQRAFRLGHVSQFPNGAKSAHSPTPAQSDLRPPTSDLRLVFPRNQKFPVVFYFRHDYPFIMKRDFRLQTSGFRLSAVLLGCLTVSSLTGFALTDANPYSAISGRNVFALKPPTPPPVVDPAKNSPPPNLELQGFTTILGRAQVLLKIKLPPRPPEPAKDRSLVMDVGQREGDVEVLEMDAYAGTVKLKNQGNIVSLNLKDNGSKPTAGPALPAPALPVAPGGIPAPAVAPVAPAAGGAPAVSTMGGTGLPTRSIRSTPPAPGAAGLGSIGGLGNTTAQPQRRELTAEEGAALLEINRKANEGRGLPFPPARINTQE